MPTEMLRASAPDPFAEKGDTEADISDTAQSLRSVSQGAPAIGRRENLGRHFTERICADRSRRRDAAFGDPRSAPSTASRCSTPTSVNFLSRWRCSVIARSRGEKRLRRNGPCTPDPESSLRKAVRPRRSGSLCPTVGIEQTRKLISESGSPRDFGLEGQPWFGSRSSALLVEFSHL